MSDETTMSPRDTPPEPTGAAGGTQKTQAPAESGKPPAPKRKRGRPKTESESPGPDAAAPVNSTGMEIHSVDEVRKTLVDQAKRGFIPTVDDWAELNDTDPTGLPDGLPKTISVDGEEHRVSYLLLDPEELRRSREPIYTMSRPVTPEMAPQVSRERYKVIGGTYLLFSGGHYVAAILDSVLERIRSQGRAEADARAKRLGAARVEYKDNEHPGEPATVESLPTKASGPGGMMAER